MIYACKETKLTFCRMASSNEIIISVLCRISIHYLLLVTLANQATLTPTHGPQNTSVLSAMDVKSVARLQDCHVIY